MLRFFSKTRFKLAAENRVGKYLRYAIGEILLVVIGILIALQVNNWNTEQKNKAEFVKTIEALTLDLHENIRNANHIIRMEYQRDSLMTLVRNKNVTREMYRNHSELRRLIIGFQFYSLIRDNLLAAIEFENNIPNSYRPLLPYLKQMIALIDRWDNSYHAAVENIINYDRWRADNFYWYSQEDSIATESEIDYLLNDPIYQNKVKVFKTGYLDNNIFNITLIRNYSVLILLQIAGIEGKQAETDTDEMIQQYGLEPYEAIIDSAFYPAKQKINFRVSHLWYNASNQSIKVLEINQDRERGNSFTLSPGKHRLTTLNDGELVEVVYENGNTKVFRSVVDGYLLIE